MNKITTLLFDLDGTLLPMDMHYFAEQYLKRLAPKFIKFLEPKQFIAHLWSATNAMISNNCPELDNQTVFWNHFTSLVPQPREVIEPIFDDFYTNDFQNLSSFTQPTPLARQIIDQAVTQGFSIVLATNPVFPAVATQERMRWAGIADHPWALVTTYENSRFCKPNLNYFLDILKYLGRQPEECLMIGNDMQEDMCASRLGIDTFLVTNCLIDQGKPRYIPSAQGNLDDLSQYIADLGHRR